MTTRPSTTSNTMSLYNPDSCYNSSFIRLMNGTCVTKYDGQVRCIRYKKLFSYIESIFFNIDNRNWYTL